MSAGRVYLLRDVDLLNGNISQYLKIGKTVDTTANRILQHQTGNPRKIINISDILATGMSEMETYLQHYYSSFRISGEWFDINNTMVTSEVVPLMNKHLAEQQITDAHIRNYELLKAMPDNGTIRNPSAQEQTWSDELKIAKEALSIAKAHHNIPDFNLRALIGTNCGIDGVIILIKKSQADYFNKASFLASLTASQHALCHQTVTEFKQKVAWQNKPQTLNNLDPILHSDLATAKSSAPSSIPLSNMLNGILTRNHTVAAEHADWLATRREMAIQVWIIEQKEKAILDSLGTDQEITGVVSWVRGDVTTTDKWSLAMAKENLPTEVAAFTTPKPNIIAVEIDECRGYP